MKTSEIYKWVQARRKEGKTTEEIENEFEKLIKMKTTRIYRSPILEKLREEMLKDKWHVKLKRWLRLQYWLFYCLVFNNKYIRRIKR